MIEPAQFWVLDKLSRPRSAMSADNQYGIHTEICVVKKMIMKLFVFCDNF